MTKWEYKTVIVDAKFKKSNMVQAVEEESNKYGEEGWELVNFHRDVVTTNFFMVFKRPKEDN